MINTFENDMFDYHKPISTVSKSVSFKGKPHFKMLRSYKSFNNGSFKNISNEKLTL